LACGESFDQLRTVSGSAERFDVAHRPEPVEGLTVEARVEPPSRAVHGSQFTEEKGVQASFSSSDAIGK
jgi:hypothetical protein